MLHDCLVRLVRDHWRGLVVFGVDVVVEVSNDVREGLLCLLVQVRDGNAGSKDGIVWVLSRHVRGGLSNAGVMQHISPALAIPEGTRSTVRVPDPPTHLGSELVQLDSGHTIVDASNDLLGDLDGVYVISVEAPAELLDPVGQPAA